MTRLSLNRRDFLRGAAGAWAAAAAGERILPAEDAAPSAPRASRAPPEDRRLVLVIFGGGTRSSETIDDPDHRYVPRLWKEMVPRGTLWTNVRVEGAVVHPNSNASIKTGHWEYEDLDWSKPPRHPTVFEIVRKARRLPDTAAWSFVYASILAKTGESTAEGFGPAWAANVVEPPTIPRSTDEEMDRIAREAAATGSADAELRAAARCAELARSTAHIATDGLRSDAARRWLDERFRAWRGAAGPENLTTSHDAFLANLAVDCMKRFSPHVVSVDFGEIDCAHYGSWSRYVDAIRRTDELTWRLWRAVEDLPDYRGRTLMLVLPDHGRQLDEPGKMGFIHHSDFYTGEGADEGCRRVWLLAVGPGAIAGKRVDRPLPITSAAATGLAFLGLSASAGAAAALGVGSRAWGVRGGPIVELRHPLLPTPYSPPLTASPAARARR